MFVWQLFEFLQVSERGIFTEHFIVFKSSFGFFGLNFEFSSMAEI